MVKKDSALNILNNEANYEEKIVNDISNFLIYSLDSIKDLRADERDKINSTLRIIMNDSKRHEIMFRGLIDKVLNYEKDDC